MDGCGSGRATARRATAGSISRASSMARMMPSRYFLSREESIRFGARIALASQAASSTSRAVTSLPRKWRAAAGRPWTGRSPS